MHHRITRIMFLLVLLVSMVGIFNSTADAQDTQPVLAIAGDEEIVFDWTTDRCEDNDIPDLPARAFRDANGQTQLLAAHYVAYRSIGDDLNTVTRDCQPVLQSNYDTDPSMYTGNNWIAGVYTEDGETIYAVLHNEYDGSNFENWYNALTLAVSTDTGQSYEHALSPPDHFIATLPYQFEAGAGPYGLFESSNIIKGPDDFYYLFARVDDFRSPDQWACLLRTGDLSDPRSWRAWDGEGFDLAFANPYREQIDNPRQRLCARIAPRSIGAMDQSITYNTYLDRYVLVGSSADTINGREVWGIYYAFSSDLIHWTHRQLLTEVEFPWTYQSGDENPILYPTLIDPDSPSRNFETTDHTAYLYFTRLNYQNKQQTLDRDLIRVPVQFFRSEVEAENPEAATYLEMGGTAQGDTPLTLTGILTGANDTPIPDATINFIATPADDAGLTYTLSGTVPQGATGALVGLRVNTECDCSAPSNLTLYASSYIEDDETDNRIPNPVFDEGLSRWATWGSADSNLSTGVRSGLTINAQPGQDAGLNSEVFPATAGAPFTVTFIAEIMPESEGSGYFTLIFVDSSEIRREQIPLEPNIIALGQATADANGEFALTTEATVQVPYRIDARYAGDEAHLPTVAQVVIE